MGRKSRLDRMPAAVREKLDALLKDKALTQAQITAELNACLQDLGESAIGKSTVNRYAGAFKEVMQKREESTLVVKQWIGRMGDIPDGDYGRAMTEILRTLSFDLSVAASQGGAGEDLPGTVRMVKDLAMTIERVERAATMNEKRVLEIERAAAQKAREDLISKAEGLADNQPLTADRLRQLLHETYGG